MRAASVSGLFNFDQVAGVNIIKIPINRYLARNERVLANAAHVIDHARLLVCDGVPFYETSRSRSFTMLRIGPSLAVKLRCFQIVVEQFSHDAVGEKLHPAIGVMDHKPFPGAQKLV